MAKKDLNPIFRIACLTDGSGSTYEKARINETDIDAKLKTMGHSVSWLKSPKTHAKNLLKTSLEYPQVEGILIFNLGFEVGKSVAPNALMGILGNLYDRGATIITIGNQASGQFSRDLHPNLSPISLKKYLRENDVYSNRNVYQSAGESRKTLRPTAKDDVLVISSNVVFSTGLVVSGVIGILTEERPYIDGINCDPRYYSGLEPNSSINSVLFNKKTGKLNAILE